MAKDDKPKVNLQIPEADLDDVNYIIRDYQVFKGQADEAKKKADAARDKLIALAGDHDRIITDKWVVPIIGSSNSGYDWASMPKELIEQLEAYKKSTPYKMIRGIKAQGMDDE